MSIVQSAELCSKFQMIPLSKHHPVPRNKGSASVFVDIVSSQHSFIYIYKTLPLISHTFLCYFSPSIRQHSFCALPSSFVCLCGRFLSAARHLDNWVPDPKQVARGRMKSKASAGQGPSWFDSTSDICNAIVVGAGTERENKDPGSSQTVFILFRDEPFDSDKKKVQRDVENLLSTLGVDLGTFKVEVSGRAAFIFPGKRPDHSGGGKMIPIYQAEGKRLISFFSLFSFRPGL